jgi:Flp pilus assembly protein TadG
MRISARMFLTGKLRRFHHDRSAMALIYVTILLPVLIGFGLLAVDVGRLTTLQSTLQHGADALALAGAAELDRRPDAITRSNYAIATLISGNRSLFATSAVVIDSSSVTVRYFEKIPGLGMNGSDADPIDAFGNTPLATDAANLADSSTRARFVEVTVNPVGFNTIFPASFIGGFDSTTAWSTAVAGFDAAVCDFTPMFICNPYEASDNTDIMEATELYNHFDRVNYPTRIGRLINMKQTGGGSAQYFPGNFGFLVPPGAANPGASTLRQYVGMASPPACFVANGVELRTGAIESVRFGFNTRFDQYDGPMNSVRNDPSYRPAQNVRRGVANDKSNGQGSACNPDDAASTAHSGLPRDTCFATDTCPNMAGRMGDGVWDKTTYWSEAHNGASLPSAISGANVSRYDVYNYELADMANRVQDDSNGSPESGEIGYPACYNGPSGSISSSPDRRIFHAAVLNCRALDASVEYGPIQGGSSNLLPVVAFVKFFITELVGGDKTDQGAADGDVWAEMVGIDMPGQANSTARDIVQLYR